MQKTNVPTRMDTTQGRNPRPLPKLQQRQVEQRTKMTDKLHEYEGISFMYSPDRIIPQQSRYEVLKRQRWKCNYCNVRLKYGGNSEREGQVAHIDHIHPFSEWQTYKGFDINEESNLQALCQNCNLTKGVVKK